MGTISDSGEDKAAKGRKERNGFRLSSAVPRIQGGGGGGGGGGL